MFANPGYGRYLMYKRLQENPGKCVPFLQISNTCILSNINIIFIHRFQLIIHCVASSPAVGVLSVASLHLGCY